MDIFELSGLWNCGWVGSVSISTVLLLHTFKWFWAKTFAHQKQGSNNVQITFLWARRNWNFRIRIINIFISTRIICNAEGDFTYMQENFKHTKYVHATFYIIWTFLWINYLAKTSIYYKNHVLYIDNSDEKSRFYEYEKKMNEREKEPYFPRKKMDATFPYILFVPHI